jgi:hypothetical protein
LTLTYLRWCRDDAYGEHEAGCSKEAEGARHC